MTRLPVVLTVLVHLVLVPILTPIAAFAAETAPASADAAEKPAIVAVIQGQLDAFRRDDADAAFGYASPMIQGMFGSPTTFIGMVRQGYPPVYRPRGVDFLDLAVVDGRLTQRVLLVGPDGAAVVALYFMERQPDGAWRIDGCVLLEAPGRSA
jgi:hypothetical protein